MAIVNKFLRENKVSKMTKTERNAWYNALSTPQKAVAICEDVLLQIKNEKYFLKSGRYVTLNINKSITQRTVKDIFKKTALDEVVAAKSITCEVCAMGSCLMSAVRLGNQVNVTDILEFYDSSIIKDDYDEYELNPGDDVDQADYIDWSKLAEAFTEREYRAMEFMFEGSDCNSTFYADGYEVRQVLDSLFISNYKKLKDQDKMIKMCKQIIKDKGYFFIEGVNLKNTNK